MARGLQEIRDRIPGISSVCGRCLNKVGQNCLLEEAVRRYDLAVAQGRLGEAQSHLNGIEGYEARIPRDCPLS